MLGSWVYCQPVAMTLRACLFVVAALNSMVLGATGSVLARYDSSIGTLPAAQGWTYLSHCLKSNCPSHPTPPYPGYVSECHFQGQTGNDCTLGHGCGPDVNPAMNREHFNAPIDPLGVMGACSYTEWMAFDDGMDYLDQPLRVSLPSRNLTFMPQVAGDRSTNWGAHAHPAFGAPAFQNAPTDHHALRIVTGSGVPGLATPALPAASGNNRNLGRINIRRDFSIPAGTSAITLVTKLACGNRENKFELIQLTGLGYRFSVGVDGKDGSATLGRFWRGNTDSQKEMFGTRTVKVALARKNVPGPHVGEFFTLRLVLRSNGTVSAWLNEDPSSEWTGTAYAAAGSSVQINPDEQAGTMWLDYLILLEGEVAVSICRDPVFDVNGDRLVDTFDLANGVDGFIDCATGPAASVDVFDALSERCKCHDVNQDNAIDMIDFAVFQRCLTAGNQPADPTCDD